MPTLDRSSLALLLRGLRGSVPATLVARTPLALLKRHRVTGKPLPKRLLGALKIARVNGLLGVRYARAVNRQRQREGRPRDAAGRVLPFHAEPRAWGTRVESAGAKTPLVAHGDQLYLTIKRQAVLACRYETAAGRPITPTAIEGYLPARDSSARQQVRRPVVVRDYRLDHLLAITLRGQEFSIATATGSNRKKPRRKAT